MRFLRLLLDSAQVNPSPGWIIWSVQWPACSPPTHSKFGKSETSLHSFRNCLKVAWVSAKGHQFPWCLLFLDLVIFRLWICIFWYLRSLPYLQGVVLGHIWDPWENMRCHPELGFNFRTWGSFISSGVCGWESPGIAHSAATMLCIWCFVCGLVGCSHSSSLGCEWSVGTRGSFTAGKGKKML